LGLNCLETRACAAQKRAKAGSILLISFLLCASSVVELDHLGFRDAQ